jgi:hypothetical protein
MSNSKTATGDVALTPVKYTVQIEKYFMRLERGIFPRSSRFWMYKLVEC